LGFVILGIVTEGWSLYYILLSKGSFTFIHPLLTTNVLYVLLISIIIAGYYIPTKGLWKMHSTLKKSKAIEDGMPTLKKICKYAKWQTSGIIGVTVVSGILFLGVLIGPATQLQTDTGNGGSSFGLLKIDSRPEVEFYKDDGSWQANVSISVLNDNVQRESKNLMVEIQSWVAIFPIKAEWFILDHELKPNQYWNISTRILAHDADDTTIKIYLLEYKSEKKDFIRVGEPWIIPSQKDLYIYDAEAEKYEDILHIKKANVTVTVFNQGNTKYIGELEIQVTAYSSYWVYSDEVSEKNNIQLNTNENWVTTQTLKIIELDPGDPIFVVKLFYDDELIDDYTFYGYH
jgi:hypothetical protein